MACKCAKKSSGGGKGLLAIGAVGAALVMANGAKGHHGSSAPTVAAESVAAAPAGSGQGGAGMPGGYTPGTWAKAFLSDADLPETACDISALKAWQAAEGTFGKFKNPLDTTEREPGSWSINSVGVQEFATWAQGRKATVTTLYNGRYPAVIAALKAGNDANAVARAVWVPHVWGTPEFSATC